MKSIIFLTAFVWLSSSLSSTMASDKLKSINLQQQNQASDPFINQTKISNTTIEKIKPLIKNWLDYYHLDIANFYTGNTSSWPFDKNDQGIYTQRFDYASDDVYIPQMHDYTPNKLKYISLIDTYH